MACGGPSAHTALLNADSLQSYTRSAAFIVTLHPLQSTTPDFWRLVYDYGCTSIVMLNQLNQSNSAWVRALGARASLSSRAQSSKSKVGVQLSHLFVVWLQTSHTAFWGLDFLICKMGAHQLQ